jgi:hypothetical protein
MLSFIYCSLMLSFLCYHFYGTIFMLPFFKLLFFTLSFLFFHLFVLFKCFNFVILSFVMLTLNLYYHFWFVNFMPAFLFYCFTIIFILCLCYVFMLLFCYSFYGITFVIIFPLFIFYLGTWHTQNFVYISGIRFSAAHKTENHSQRCALTKQPGVFMAICRGKIYYGHFSKIITIKFSFCIKCHCSVVQYARVWEWDEYPCTIHL